MRSSGTNVNPVRSARILYDPECDFCRVCLALILAWDRHGRLRPVALGSAEADALLAGMPEALRMQSWHLVELDGGVHSAGAAFPPLLRLLPGGGGPAALAARFPRASEGGYRWVADRRSWFGRALPRAIRHWADRRVERWSER
jgi:predicted DCC family thiol-disulfide oxidoreductase YuxK